MKSLLSLFSVLFSAASFSQFSCGTSPESFSSELARRERISNLAPLFQAREMAGNNLYSIPIKPHLFSNNDGSNGVSFTQLNDALAELNRRFAQIGVVFYFSGTEFEQTASSDFNAGTQDEEIEDGFYEQFGATNAINLYIAQTVLVGGSGVGGYSFLNPQWQQYNRVWVVTGQLNDNKTTPHEFGHYFGLPHTFNNSDSNIITQRELVTRSFSEILPRKNANCGNAGDFICDTESDPFNVSPSAANCIYTGSETDANGDLFHPQNNNYMDYRWCPPYAYTTGQYNRMTEGAMLVTNANDFTLDAPETAQDAPQQPVVSNEDYSILVSWTDVSDVETGFIIERAENPSGPFIPIGGVEANAVVYHDVDGVAGVTYFYRIKPSNSAANYSGVSSGIVAPGCGNLNGQTCSLVVNPSEAAWNINRFILTRDGVELIDNGPSGCSENGIGNFYADVFADILPGDQLDFNARSTTGPGNTGFNVIGRLWVDWNQNSIFEETELLEDASSFAQVSGSFMVPEDISEGSYRLRVGLSAGSYLEPCGVDFGELEDYRLVYAPLAVGQPVSQFGISVFPNPTRHLLEIKSSDTLKNITVFDASGKKVLDLNGQKTIDVNSLEVGFYMLRATSDNGTSVAKFIKE
ncbi:zinc-dependent metalloprotease [Flavobacterium silvaticum]|uniref:T9SS type A sorting domain-containing protein n=1 Tax=Flavobacterium silvaticum TaxID=1852020 RepID=A0A972FVT4_9FLAO|nr:zinc-dependent metalloprotease [Flavobacterium silvaticum]NMH29633.1 T9SS type A sorting domain-containing protein [Flavobacterium silvaticum]